MFTVFLICAVVAGTIFLFQFVLLMVGFGLDGADFDADVPDDSSFDFDGDGGEIDSETGMIDHGSTMLAGIISVRTVVAAFTMFGLVGMAVLSAQESSLMASIYATVAAVAGGAVAMFIVHFLMRTLYRLGADGKVRIQNAVGKTATVYVPIPGDNDGRGKIQIRLQGRLVEVLAITKAAEELKTGTQVRVTGVVTGSTLKVEPLTEKQSALANAEVEANA